MDMNHKWLECVRWVLFMKKFTGPLQKASLGHILTIVLGLLRLLKECCSSMSWGCQNGLGSCAPGSSRSGWHVATRKHTRSWLGDNWALPRLETQVWRTHLCRFHKNPLKANISVKRCLLFSELLYRTVFSSPFHRVFFTKCSSKKDFPTKKLSSRNLIWSKFHFEMSVPNYVHFFFSW